jgi:hypothetical protein
MLVYTHAGDKDLDDLLNPSKVLDSIPQWRGQFEKLARLKAQTDDAGRKGNPQGKDPGFKVIARFPNQLHLITLLAKEPDFFRDAKTARRILRKYPMYQAYSGASI